MKIRYKDYDWLAEGESNDEFLENENENETQNGIGDRGFECGSHWLSNASVIASMPPERLTAAIEFHSTMLRLLRAEALSRSFANSTGRQRPRRSRGAHHRQGMVGLRPTSAGRGSARGVAKVLANLGADVIARLLKERMAKP